MKTKPKKCFKVWDDGSCCCNCQHHQKRLYKHPSNKLFGNGNINEQCGWVCFNPELRGGVYFDKEHGMCECYEVKKLC